MRKLLCMGSNYFRVSGVGCSGSIHPTPDTLIRIDSFRNLRHTSAAKEGPLAHLVERFHGMEEVTGSSLVKSLKSQTNSKLSWAFSSFGRALPWHGRGDRFEPGKVHQTKASEKSGVFVYLTASIPMILNRCMSHVYILWSEKLHKYYIGSTSDLSRRVSEHNRGQTTSTASGRPWKCVFAHKTDTLHQAKCIESRLKRWKNKSILDQIVTRGQLLSG